MMLPKISPEASWVGGLFRAGAWRLGLLLAWGLGGWVASLGAAPLETELGSGLVYVRVHQLPTDLPPQTPGPAPACIVDLRYVDADAAAAAAFNTWLKTRVTPRAPVFVLANADTSAALLKPLAAQPRIPGLAVVGIARSRFHPDIGVTASADDERRAYDAVEKGAAIGTLLTENANKVRNDEASLSKDRLAAASAEAVKDAEAGKRAPPPIDATLQRAVHLHRALAALRKI